MGLMFFPGAENAAASRNKTGVRWGRTPPQLRPEGPLRPGRSEPALNLMPQRQPGAVGRWGGGSGIIAV